MKRVAAHQHRHNKKEYILFVCAIASLFVIAYCIVSVLMWRDASMVFSERRQTIRSDFVALVKNNEDIVELVTPDEYQQLKREVDTLCQLPSAVQWQSAIIPSLRTRLRVCDEQQVKYHQALAQYYNMVKFHETERYFATMLHATQQASLEMREWSPSEQQAIWKNAQQKITTYASLQQIQETKQSLTVALLEVEQAWQQAERGNTRQLPSAYDRLANVQLTLLDERKALHTELRERVNRL